MNIQRGLVKDLGYEDTECTFVTGNDGIQYYFVNGTTLTDGLYVVTPNVKEALGREDYSTLGILGEDGNVVIPCENKRVELLADRFLLIEKSEVEGNDVKASLAVKDDPMQANKYNTDSLNIKRAMENEMGPDGVFVFDDMFSEANLYDFTGKKVLGDEITGFSFIGQVGNDLYLHSININDSIKVIKTSTEEAAPIEPIAPSADVITPTAPETVAPDSFQSYTPLQPEATEVSMTPGMNIPEPVMASADVVAPIADSFEPALDSTVSMIEESTALNDVVPTAIPNPVVPDSTPSVSPTVVQPEEVSVVKEDVKTGEVEEAVQLTTSANIHPEDKYLDPEDKEEPKKENTNEELDTSRFDKYFTSEKEENKSKNAIYDEAVGVIKNLVEKNRRLENENESKGVRIKELELDNKDFAKTIKSQRERIEKLETEKEQHLLEIRKHKKSIETLETEKREFLRTIEAQSRKIEDQESRLRSQGEELSKHESGKEQLVKLLEDVTEVLD